MHKSEPNRPPVEKTVSISGITAPRLGKPGGPNSEASEDQVRVSLFIISNVEAFCF